ncbi:MAG: hypothetical protein M3P08_18480 [Thermoproteota archaeon]|nr:hypothetical protein [Thermoproteota archaeon]
MNGIRPYQKTIPTGTNGTEDYTSWQFTGDPNYATVKLGQNKITAKYSCFPMSDTSNTHVRFFGYIILQFAIDHSHLIADPNL